MHDVMQSLMTGMFWGGVVMALPPVALGVAIAVFIIKQQRLSRQQSSTTPPHR